MSGKYILQILMIFIVFGSAGAALGFEQDDIQMHGFASQGYLKSTDNNYLGNSKDGSWEFNEVGINFAVPISDTLRFGIQFFSRDLGSYGNNNLFIDWAFMDYSYTDWLGFRAGKIKTPMGFYNRQRDADILRTGILLEQSVYPEVIRDFFVAFQGFSAYGSFGFNKAGDLDYEIYWGVIEGPSDTTSFEGGIATMVPVLYIDLLGQQNNYDIVLSHMVGGMLTWNTPIPGLRIGGSGMHAEGEMDIIGTATTIDLTLNQVSIFSGEYEKGPVTFAAELLLMDIEFSLAGIPDIPIESQGYYGRISWHVVNWLSVAISYGLFYPQPDDKDGSNFEDAGLPSALAYQKDAALSFRFDIVEKWILKLETHYMDGIAQVNGTDYASMKDKWFLFAIKSSLSF